jgi:hypothetical protein
MKEDDTRERHPIRSLLKLAFLAGVVLTVGRFVARKKEEYAGLTETQARDKLMEKIASKVGDDTARDIADQVIPKLKERGLIVADPIEEVADEGETHAGEATDSTSERVTDAADKVAEAVDSVVKD